MLVNLHSVPLHHRLIELRNALRVRLIAGNTIRSEGTVETVSMPAVSLAAHGANPASDFASEQLNGHGLTLAGMGRSITVALPTVNKNLSK